MQGIDDTWEDRMALLSQVTGRFSLKRLTGVEDELLDLTAYVNVFDRGNVGRATHQHE
jgi:hypothetical protein